MKTHIIIETQESPNPGTLNHLGAMIMNPNNRNHIEVVEEEEFIRRVRE